jgi:hypothetical protein
MWDKIVQTLPQYPSAVLTGQDAQGYPYSVRCRPQPDNTQQVLRVQLPPGAPIQPGPAGLLCHYHNDQLWDLKSFTLRGVLAQDGTSWTFRPLHLPESSGKGVVGIIRFLIKSRRDANAYLKKRGLPRPRIPWDEVEALKR